MSAIRATLPPGTPVELWWQDEARIGQKNTLTRLWARRGTRPRLPHDQRTQYAYIFGAICPEKGKGAGLVLPRCNALAMNAHLAEISGTVDPGAHAVLMLDGAGWHIAHDLVVPDNITLLPLPPRASELNPVENVWQFCVTTGSATASSSPTTTSSTDAAKPGTSSPISPGKSCPSACASGPIGYDQRPLVLGLKVVYRGRNQSNPERDTIMNSMFLLFGISGQCMLENRQEISCTATHLSPDRAEINVRAIVKIGEGVTCRFDGLGLVHGHAVRLSPTGFSLVFDIPDARRERIIARIAWLLACAEPPRRTRLHDEPQAVEHLAQIVVALTRILSQKRQIRRHQRPFFIGHVGGIRSAISGHASQTHSPASGS